MNVGQLEALREGDRLTSQDGLCAVVREVCAGESVRVHVYGRGNYGQADEILTSENCGAWEVDPVYICDCGHPESVHSYITRGYGRDAEGHTYCYDCCAERDRKAMIETGKIALYLTHRADSVLFHVTNWPGSLSFPLLGQVRVGDHNIGGRRYDAWFTGPDRHVWHGVQYGENTQIIHCRRTKRMAV